MPNVNTGALRALKLAAKEAKRAKNAEASLIAAASRSYTSPMYLSEPHANIDVLDPPPPSLYKPEKQVAA